MKQYQFKLYLRAVSSLQQVLETENLRVQNQQITLKIFVLNILCFLRLYRNLPFYVFASFSVKNSLTCLPSFRTYLYLFFLPHFHFSWENRTKQNKTFLRIWYDYDINGNVIQSVWNKYTFLTLMTELEDSCPNSCLQTVETVLWVCIACFINISKSCLKINTEIRTKTSFYSLPGWEQNALLWLLLLILVPALNIV